MIRIIVKQMDIGDAAHAEGAHAMIYYRTFDIENAKLEAILAAQPWSHSAIIGGEVIARDAAARGEREGGGA